MDEDVGLVTLYLNYFDVSSTGFPWQDARCDEIISRRADMNDKFIFDILLTSGGIENPAGLFPPTNRDDLEALLSAIDNTTYDTLKKECLVYFLLKWHEDGREEKFKQDRCLPPQFAALADAYWHLDTGRNISRAVSILSDNRLNRDFASKILHAISISPDPSPLIIQYVRTAKPLLTEPQDVWKYCLALADSSLLEAWRFQRTFNETEELRKQLLSKILEWCTSPAPRPHALSTLLSLPLSRFEEDFLYRYAIDSPMSLSRSAIAILRDLVCVRLIQGGKHAEAVKADHAFAASTLNESKADAAERRKMVKELYEALPLTERTLLDSELEVEQKTTGGSKPKTPVKPVPRPTAAADLSTSWEQVQRPPMVNGLSMSSRILPGNPSLPISSLGANIGSTSTLPSVITNPASSTIRNISFTPRQSFPSSSSTALAASSSRPPLFQSTSPAPPSSSRSQVQPPTAPMTAATFAPASRQPNAFYKPPPNKQSETRAFGFDSIGASASLSGSVNGGRRSPNKEKDQRDASQDQDDDDEQLHEDVMTVDAKKGRPNGRVNGMATSSNIKQNTTAMDVDVGPPRRELGFSLFQNSAPVYQAPLPKNQGAQPKKRQAPPGALMSSDEGEEEDEVPPLPSKALPPATASRTRGSVRHTQPAAPASKKRARGRQSIPGALPTDSDEDEDQDAEDQDDVAPLPSPPQRRGGTRKTSMRSTTPISDAGADEDGAQTRRRSSRLLGAVGTSAPDVSPPMKKSRAAVAEGKGAVKPGRKGTRAQTGASTKKKR